MIVLEQVSVSQSHQYSSQDVAFLGGTGGCACVSESVGCMYVDGMHMCRLVCILFGIGTIDVVEAHAMATSFL